MQRFPGHRIIWILPAFVMLVWLSAALIGGPIFGKLSSIANNDQTSFLPADAESTKVQNILTTLDHTRTIPGLAIITSSRPLQQQDLGMYMRLGASLRTQSGVDGAAVQGPIPSQDRQAVEFVIPVKEDGHVRDTVDSLRSLLAKAVPQGVASHLAGPAGLSADFTSAFNGIDGLLLYVALGVVFVILLLVYRSIFLPFLVLSTSMVALTAAGFVVYHGVGLGWFKLNGQTQGILSILVIGATTDYSLLLTSRLREALETTESRWQAIRHALRRCVSPIIASGSTVILGLLCMLVSELQSNKSLGPVSAVGILFALAAALTFLPAVLVLFGRAAYWPYRPHLQVGNQDTGHGIWGAVAGFIGRHARPVWLVCIVMLIGVGLALPTFKSTGVSELDALLNNPDAVVGERLLEQHFPAGQGNPVIIIADAAHAQTVLARAAVTPGISAATIVPVPHTQGVMNGKVLIDAILASQPESAVAKTVVRQLRVGLRQVDSSVMIGGLTAVVADANDASMRDLHKIVPLVLVVVLIVLIVLLRSVLAPLILVLSVILSFSATIGVSALLFNHVLHYPGSDPAIPLFGFIFLVALGIDYNIFLMTRVREESIALGTRPGILRGLKVTGSVITSAGVVLASTFAALAVLPLLFLIQIAFIVAFGVLLDTIIVRSLLVPAMCYDIGSRIWWPSHLSHHSDHR